MPKFNLFSRLAFAIEHKTFQRVAVNRSNPSVISIYYEGKTIRLARRCPHQGAPLEKGYFEGDFLLCPWHGCRYSLKGKGEWQADKPTQGRCDLPASQLLRETADP